MHRRGNIFYAIEGDAERYPAHLRQQFIGEDPTSSANSSESLGALPAVVHSHLIRAAKEGLRQQASRGSKRRQPVKNTSLAVEPYWR